MGERPKIRGRGLEAGASILRGSLTQREGPQQPPQDQLLKNRRRKTSSWKLPGVLEGRRGEGGFAGRREGRGLTRPREPAGVGGLEGLGRPQETVGGQAAESRGTPALRMGWWPRALSSLPVLPLQPLLSLGSNSFPGGCPPPSLPSQRPAGTGPLCPPFCVPARQIQGDVTFPLWKQPR